MPLGMELQMQMQMQMMDPGCSGTSMWLGHSPSASIALSSSLAQPSYHDRFTTAISMSTTTAAATSTAIQQHQASNCSSSSSNNMGFHEPMTCHGSVLWHEKRQQPLKHHSPDGHNLGQLRIGCNNTAVASGSESLPTSSEKYSSSVTTASPPTPSAASFHQSVTNGLLKRRAIATSSLSHQQTFELSEQRKHARRAGSVGSNGSSVQPAVGWSTQVEELAEHLIFDGPLSAALTASDLANAVGSYNMSEAILALPSLTIFKQEAPSPENQVATTNNSNINQNNRSRDVCTSAVRNDRDTNNNSSGNDNSTPTLVINGATPRMNSSSGGLTGSNGNHVNNGRSNGNRETCAADEQSENLNSLLYSNGDVRGATDNYPVNSSSALGNPLVSSSHQGNEFNEDSRFQYVLAAATSIATKLNEETLTYLNQGQSYEIKLKKLGDLSAYRGKILNSSIRICFHERRLQYTEREQILAWQRARPGERLLQVDVPLSYGILDVSQLSTYKNGIEFMWDPTKEVGVYIKVNCISTEFTPKKHGGEKGVPFRILVETRLPSSGTRLHAASCQVKVFKLKGADRKHKQDRDKILRRPHHEQELYQPSYDCTVLSDIPLESLSPEGTAAASPNDQSERQNVFGSSTDVISSFRENCAAGEMMIKDDNGMSPVGGLHLPVEYNDTLEAATAVGNTELGDERCQQRIVALDPTENGKRRGSSSIATTVAATSSSSVATASTPVQINTLSKLTGFHNAGGEKRVGESVDDGGGMDRNEIDAIYELAADASTAQTNAWLRAHRFYAYQETFASFSAGDILRLSRDDLIQICSLADGIRLFNALHSKAPTPKLTVYLTIEGNPAQPWRVVYLQNLNSALFTTKLVAVLNLPQDHLQSLVIQGPQGVHVLVTNELVANIRDESMYFVEIIKDSTSDWYKILLKPTTQSFPSSPPQLPH